jgi:hypothetical protein
MKLQLNVYHEWLLIQEIGAIHKIWCSEYITFLNIFQVVEYLIQYMRKLFVTVCSNVSSIYSFTKVYYISVMKEH